MLGSLFNTILVEPLTWTLNFIYGLIPDYGISIIILTFLIRLILYPLNQKSLESQKQMAVLQPQIKNLQKKFKDDKIKQSEEMMRLYKEQKVSPFSGIISMFLQFPILIALFVIFKQTSGSFLGVFDLSEKSFILALAAGLIQFWQVKEMSHGQDKKMMSFQYFMPIITVIFGYSFPSALPLYWIANTIFMIAQQRLLNKKHERSNKNSAPAS